MKAMKKVAGRLRLELAQYREVESFAQFGSELDETTQRQIARGVRVVEVLKQDQYAPMHVMDQVIQIFAAVNGFLDDLEVSDIKRFDRELLEYIRNAEQELRDELVEKLDIDDELTEKLKKAITAFKKTFASSAVLSEKGRGEASESEGPGEGPGGEAEQSIEKKGPEESES